MSYSYLKVLDLDTNTTMYKSIRVIDSYREVSQTGLTDIVFSTIFPFGDTNASCCTFYNQLKGKTNLLKSPNHLIQGVEQTFTQKRRYQFIFKNENNEEEKSFILELALVIEWYNDAIVPAYVSGQVTYPTYYKNRVNIIPVFRIRDKNHNDVTNEIFGNSATFPYHWQRYQDTLRKRGYTSWYRFSNQIIYSKQNVVSFDESKYTDKSNICYGNYNNTTKKFLDISNVINIYYSYDSTEQKYFLSFSNNYTTLSDVESSSFSYYKNLYAPYNINGVTTNPINYCGFLTPAKRWSIYLDTNLNPLYDSDEDISNDDPDDSNNTQSTGGNAVNYGNGIGEDDTEYIDFPSLSTTNPAIKSGLYRLVKIDSTNLTTLSNFLWSTTPLDTLIKVFSKPFDCIVSLMTLPFNVNADSSTSELKILDYSTGVQVYKNCDAAQQLTFGSCDCNESFGNFLDYDNTTVSIYLPYIGIQPLDIQDVMDSVLTLVYNVDNQTGQCVALLKSTKNNMDVDSVCYTWSGNLSNLLPLTGADNTQYLQGLFNSISSVAVGNSGGSITNSFNTIMQGDKQIMKSGRLDSNTGNLSVQYPYIKIERPIWARPTNYLDMLGQPYFAEDTIGNLTGFVKVVEVKSELNGVPEESRDKIIELLKDGVYI